MARAGRPVGPGMFFVILTRGCENHVGFVNARTQPQLQGETTFQIHNCMQLANLIAPYRNSQLRTVARADRPGHVFCYFDQGVWEPRGFR